jgi:hypothetical protein
MVCRPKVQLYGHLCSCTSRKEPAWLGNHNSRKISQIHDNNPYSKQEPKINIKDVILNIHHVTRYRMARNMVKEWMSAFERGRQISTFIVTVHNEDREVEYRFKMNICIKIVNKAFDSVENLNGN